MSNSPTISVLMPVYNAERYVVKAVKSILTQTMTDFECLIIDDGSTDRSYTMVQALAKHDHRIHLAQSPNQGVSRTRNQLLKQATGEFIAVMDADDIALPSRLERQLAFLRQHPEVVCVGSAHDIIDEKGRFLTVLKLPETDTEIQRLALAGHGSICHPCALIRRDSVLQIGGYDDNYASAHDLDLWLKLGEIGQLANLSEPLLQYRIHTQSVSGKHYISQRKEAREACEQAWQRRGITGKFEAADPWRPGTDRASRLFFTLKYGWWAFNSRQRSTAIHYGLRAIGLNPFTRDSWTLLLSALLKPLPAR